MEAARGSEPKAPSAVADGRVDERLFGAVLPSVDFESTGGRINLAELAADLLVLFVYPHATGLPDAPVSDWDLIPGARGCTAQACGFRDHHDRLRDLGAEVAGLSVQAVDEQQAFATRVGLHYRLISDPTLQLADALRVPTFAADGRTFYRRLTLIAREGRVVKVFCPVLEPESHAWEVVSWLETSSGV